MGKEPDEPPQEPTGPAEEPPPFQPDPELISYMERGGKPSEREVREMTAKAQRRSIPP